MEKGQIVRYASMQIAALIYGILSCGAAVKLGRPIAEGGREMSSVYWDAAAYRDYGTLLFIAIIAWTVLAAYHSSSFSGRNIDEGWLMGTGLFLFLVLFGIGTFLAVGAIASIMNVDTL